MATFNGAKYIREQVNSILAQEFVENYDTEMELIVSDDGSTDGTTNILEDYCDERIKIFHHSNSNKHKYYQGHFAATENFAYAISKAAGNYIFLSDQDDVWYPWKLDKSISVLKQHGGVVGAAFDLGDANLNIIGKIIYKKQPFFTLRFSHSLYGFSCGFVRDELKWIMPIPNVPQHDTFIMLTAQWRNKMHYIDDVCAIHRWSGEHNVTSDVIYNFTPNYVRLFYRFRIWVTVIFRALIIR
jgi:glycosyltransferase involved in cell wall biosynthesis